MVDGSIASLKVARTVVLTRTPVAPAVGTVEITVGGTASAAPEVVKVHACALARALPATSLAPVEIVAV
jgi:hypothetical protein